jgi:hypothetical protein
MTMTMTDEPAKKPRKTQKRSTRTNKFQRNGKKIDQGKEVWGPGSKIRIGPAAVPLFIDPESVKEWDDEEILRGQRKARNGKFVGQPPAVVPMVVYREMVRRQLEGANREMIVNLGSAVERLTQIATGSGYDAKDQLAAIKLIMDRVMGTAPQRIIAVDPEADSPWKTALVASIVDMPEAVQLDNPDIEDAEIIDDIG